LEKDIFSDFQNYEDEIEILNKVEKTIDKEEDLKSNFDDDYGFSEVLKQRREKKDALRKRLYKYYLKDNEIDKLFEIIEKAEIKMEKIKKSVDYSNYTRKDMYKMAQDLEAVQLEMKSNFDFELNKVLKAKYENAKKILEKRKQQNNLKSDE